MDNVWSALSDIDRVCGQFAAALHNAEPQVYVIIALTVLLSVVLFPRKDDLDQA
jgi:hypothetical protein